MTKEEFMWRCWKERLTASEMLRQAIQMELSNDVIPTRKEYLNYYKETNEIRQSEKCL